MRARSTHPEDKNPQCRKIVQRAFRELRQCGVPEASAFESATTLYRIHHPEVPEREARFRIAEWIE